MAALLSPAWKAFLQQNLTRGEDVDGEADEMSDSRIGKGGRLVDSIS